MPASRTTCSNCNDNFTVSDSDRRFYAQLQVPEPTWCPMCRQIRRHGHVNDYVYYPRTCDSCNKRFVATFPQSSDYKVICQTCWYSENRDDKAESRDYDPSRSFFEQFDELMYSAPQLGNIAIRIENSEYCESIADCKNCYLISECSNCEDSYYAYWIQKTISSVDVCYLHECERCYETSDSFNCYGIKYSSNCRNCSHSLFLDNCISCDNCAFCVNLRHQKFCLFNQQYSETEYHAALAKLKVGSHAEFPKLFSRFQEILKTQPRRHLQMESVENSWGDYMRNTKNCAHVWHCYDAEDCSYGEHVWRGAKDCMDVCTCGRDAELIYESTNTNMGSYFCKFCRYCWGCRYTEYSNMCVDSQHLFGCVGLKAHSEYCILNKQYSKADYEALLPKIKQQMLQDREYGEFFPLSIALFGYNNSVSFDDRGHTKEEVMAKGWKWEDALPGSFGKETLALAQLPDHITSTDESICQQTLACESCRRNYKIIKPELEFYRAENIFIPRKCPDCRHRERLGRRNKKEYARTTCNSCRTEVITTLDTSFFRNILCGPCYEREIYTG